MKFVIRDTTHNIFRDEIWIDRSGFHHKYTSYDGLREREYFMNWICIGLEVACIGVLISLGVMMI